MYNRTVIRLLFCSALILFGCSKDSPVSTQLTQSEQGTALGKSGGATQISGLGELPGSSECTDIPPGAAFSLKMTGDIDGCLYVFVDEVKCSPSGTYRERGREFFDGTYNGVSGTFRTNYKFEAKYTGLPGNCDITSATELFGRCQHPIVVGSGTGAFAGVTGRIDF